MPFEFKEELTQADWLHFKDKIDDVFENDIKPVLREVPTSDITAMVKKLEWLAAWLPWMGEQKAKAERFYKIGRAEALANCIYTSPELKVRIWLEGEISEIEYLYNRLDAIYRASTDSGMKIQTCLRVEMDLKNISGKA